MKFLNDSDELYALYVALELVQVKLPSKIQNEISNMENIICVLCKCVMEYCPSYQTIMKFTHQSAHIYTQLSNIDPYIPQKGRKNEQLRQIFVDVAWNIQSVPSESTVSNIVGLHILMTKTGERKKYTKKQQLL